MPWVSRYPWGGIQAQSAEAVPPASIQTAGPWVWEQPVGTPRPDLAPSAPPPHTLLPPGQTGAAPAAGGASAAGGGTTTARARAAELVFNAMRGLPRISPSFLSSLQAGDLPPPSSLTPQTLQALSNDPFLSDNFFALIRAAGVFPTSFLAETGRFQPRGQAVPPSFI